MLSECLESTAERNFYSNLKLLGFEQSAEMETLRKHSQGGPTMFDGQVSNENGLICVLHFLFMIIGPRKRMVKDFGNCFPIRDNSDRRTFKANARELLQEMERDGKIPTGTARGSALNMARGKSAQVLVWTLSHVALRAELNRMEGTQSEQGRLPDLVQQVSKAYPFNSTIALCMKKLLLIEQRRFEQTCAKINQLKKQEDRFADELSQERQQLEDELASLKEMENNLMIQQDQEEEDDEPKPSSLEDESNKEDKLILSLEKLSSLETLRRHLEVLEKEKFEDNPKVRGDMFEDNDKIARLWSSNELALQRQGDLGHRIDPIQLGRCLEKIEQCKQEIAKLTKELQSGSQQLDKNLAENAKAILLFGMR